MTPEDLKTWRKSLGWTQERAAKSLGYGLTQYGAMERAPPISALPISVGLACGALFCETPPYPECLTELD